MVLVLLLFIPQLCSALSLTAQQRRSQHDTLSTKPELLPRGAVPDGVWWTLYGLRNTLQLPECASDACLNAEVLAEKCGSMQCTVSIFWGSFCLSQAFLINSTCAQGGGIFNYTTCSESCTLSRERPLLLQWFNQTWGNAAWEEGGALPANWTTLLSPVYDDLLPWKWAVHGGTGSKCPSSSEKLGAFAAINVAMALAVPLLGRRTIVNKITFGMLGRKDTATFMLLGPLGGVLHILSNMVNAFLVNKTSGLSSKQVAELIFLWDTRPRFGWFIALSLTGYQSPQQLYLASGASIMLAELIMQLCSMYAMGYTAQHARLQGFYTGDGRVQTHPQGIDALIMYAGAILWLVVMVFAFAACFLPVREIYEYVFDSLRGDYREFARILELVRRNWPGWVAKQRRNGERGQREQNVSRRSERRVDGLDIQTPTIVETPGTEWIRDRLSYCRMTRGAVKDGLARLDPSGVYDSAKEVSIWHETLQSLATECESISKTLLEEAKYAGGEDPQDPNWISHNYTEDIFGATAKYHYSSQFASLAKQCEEDISKCKELGDLIRKRKAVLTISWVLLPALLVAWIAQWLFWTGFVKLMGDRYAYPPLESI